MQCAAHGAARWRAAAKDGAARCFFDGPLNVIERALMIALAKRTQPSHMQRFRMMRIHPQHFIALRLRSHPIAALESADCRLPSAGKIIDLLYLVRCSAACCRIEQAAALLVFLAAAARARIVTIGRGNDKEEIEDYGRIPAQTNFKW